MRILDTVDFFSRRLLNAVRSFSKQGTTETTGIPHDTTELNADTPVNSRSLLPLFTKIGDITHKRKNIKRTAKQEVQEILDIVAQDEPQNESQNQPPQPR